MSPEIDEIILQIRKNNEEALELLFVCFEKHFAILENRMLYQYRLRSATDHFGRYAENHPSL